MTTLNRNDYFIDISAYQEANPGVYGERKTVIKVSEGIGWYNPKANNQSKLSDPIGYYHFARFGGSEQAAVNEANYFLRNLPNKKVKYLVVDWEDSEGPNKQANTNAVLTFMRVVKQAGFYPVFYGYVFHSADTVYLDQIVREFPKSLWMAGYAFGYQPRRDYTQVDERQMQTNMSAKGIAHLWQHVRWVQFTSTGVTSTYSGSLDKNIVLIPDEYTLEEIKKEGNKMYTIQGKNTGIALMDGGSFFALLDSNDPTVLWNNKTKPVPHYVVSDKTFAEIQANAVNNLLKKGK